MKRGVLLVFSLLCCLISTSARSFGKSSGPACTCTTRNDPVCGSNGKQYSNSCEAKCASVRVACEGSCPCFNKKGSVIPSRVNTAACSCPRVGSPVCSTTGKTYGSSCLAACSSEKVACNHACPCDKECDAANVRCAKDPCDTATCPNYPQADCKASHCKVCTAEFYLNGKKINDCKSTDCRCPSHHSPVCGTDNKTYGNDCHANCKGVEIQCNGKCPCSTSRPCPCAKIYRPVCGVNGQSYGNDCLAKCAGVKTSCQGKCPCKSNTRSCVCTREYKPVCGSDGKTYGNTCQARCARTEVQCEGRCPCAESKCDGMYHNCFVDPCSHATCSAYSKAECRANYCNGCHAEFYMNGKKVDCEANCSKEGEPCSTNYSDQFGINSTKKCCSGLQCCGPCKPLASGMYSGPGVYSFTQQAATCLSRCPVCKG